MLFDDWLSQFGRLRKGDVVTPLLLAFLFHFCGTSIASAACGDRDGPGYRGPNGKCVGWAQLGKVCGSPPETRCSPENVRSGADGAATKGKEIEIMRLMKQRQK